MRKIVLGMISVVTLIWGATSCTKPYFEDTGIHTDQYDGTIWSFLNSKPEHFSDIIAIIKAADMENVFNEESNDITFFAPKNPSIKRCIYKLNRQLELIGRDTISAVESEGDIVFNYTEIKPEVWKEFVGLYVIPSGYELKDIAQVDTVTYVYKGQTYRSYNGRSMNIGLFYNSAGGVQYAGYRQIVYGYIRDFAAPERSRINAVVATSNNFTYNGVVHVLEAYRHTFPFDFEPFYERVSTVGLVTP